MQGLRHNHLTRDIPRCTKHDKLSQVITSCARGTCRQLQPSHAHHSCQSHAGSSLDRGVPCQHATLPPSQSQLGQQRQTGLARRNVPCHVAQSQANSFLSSSFCIFLSVLILSFLPWLALCLLILSIFFGVTATLPQADVNPRRHTREACTAKTVLGTSHDAHDARVTCRPSRWVARKGAETDRQSQTNGDLRQGLHAASPLFLSLFLCLSFSPLASRLACAMIWRPCAGKHLHTMPCAIHAVLP